MTRSSARSRSWILLILIATAGCGHRTASSDARRDESDECAARDVVESPQDAAVRARLGAARAGVDFDAVPLDQAVEFLARISGTKIVILPAAREGKSDEESPPR